ncbi:hypothetical protein I3842_15G018000 [Carya illinoinensis]|uniref:Receptor-like serine/threonine-protein kinase n=1 Tax=Carya illinoinensis TaxID=32201 RepID=A0A922D1K8_CARIL|nr:hypothetical protein I3842_15G018000 [Carya illinoinensis]
MASTALTFLFLSALSMATAQQRNFNLSLGSSLSTTGNSFLLSQSGIFAFGFLPFGNGFTVGIWYEGTPQKTVVWTANRNDPPVSSTTTIVFTSDGRLILQELGGHEKSNITGATGPASIASILNSGNLVLYNSNSSIIWQSFDYPTDNLLPGQPLRADSELVSSISETNHSKGSFRILMQNDGNLGMYPVDSPLNGDYSYWATDTNFSLAGENATLMLDGSGRLYILNTTGVLFRNITNGGPTDGMIYRAAIDADGIFRLYSLQLNGNSDWSIEWSEPKDKCSPKGLCGINAYCDLVNQQPLCSCPPGFVSINQKRTTLGCDRNFVAQSCSFENEHIEYTIQELQNTTWAESTYDILSNLTREECNQACLVDCSCEAALFVDQECRKQRLPLTFGKRQQEDGKQITTVFLKVGMGSGQNGTPAPNESRKGLQMDLLIISVACASFALSILAFVAFLILRYRLWAYRKVRNEVSEGLIDDVSLRAYTYSELEVATNGFLEKLGKGSFGTVFKGTLSSGQRKIAVKRLEKIVAEGEVEFLNEMRSIGRTCHRNLVRLLGYCHDGSNRLLVYEYMSNGTLSDYLFKSEIKPNWDERIKISLNIARGILYLHEECETQIIHCDINPNNILMDEFGCAKIADFGLAKLLMPDHSRTLTGIRGTRGYVAPEWHKNLPITVKVDVYSFGIVFLVIICCRRSIDINVPEDEAVLVDWVYNCFKDNEMQKLVPEEVVVLDQQNLERMVRIGLWCIEEDPAVRPSMKKVVQMLEGTVEIIPIPPCAGSSFQH